MSGYVFDNAWTEERARLGVLEAFWDEGTTRALTDLGCGPGWRCLEVGGGAGSIATWMSDRAGETGHVLAVDLDTRFLEAIERENLEVRKMNIVTDELGAEGFDLAHSRLLIEHLGEGREIALRRMFDALKPGGWMLIEDFDWKGECTYPASALQEKVVDAIFSLMEGSGYDRAYGRRLVSDLTDIGLLDVQARGTVRVVRGGTPENDAYARMVVEQLRAPLIASGLLTDEEIERSFMEIANPDRVNLTPVMISAWGRKL